MHDGTCPDYTKMKVWGYAAIAAVVRDRHGVQLLDGDGRELGRERGWHTRAAKGMDPAPVDAFHSHPWGPAGAQALLTGPSNV